MRSIHDHHFGWDNGLAPVLRVAPGDRVEFAVLDASGGRIRRESTTEDVLTLDAEHANPVTGPVYVEGAEPGDTLVVDLLDFDLSGWGWTAVIPGFGLLADDFTEPFLHISEHDAQRVAFTPEVMLPTRPFTGTIGVAPAEPGRHGAIPPRSMGGNMDIADITHGARLYLPVQVPGALFSVGDTHAAQGDGEVCGTAVETPTRVRLGFDLRKGEHLPYPRIDLPGERARPADPAGYRITTGIGPDLMAAAQDAIRGMIDLLGKDYRLDPELAYCLCSVAVDLRLSELVNIPNWTVSAYLPRSIFR
jgi:acetamidase/formamidase